MHRIPVALRVAIALAALSSVAATQNVFVVAPVLGPGVFSTDVQTAVNAAVDGDFVLVKAGTYPGFTITAKSLSVVADAGAGVTIAGSVQVTSLAAQHRVLVAGLTIQAVGIVHGLWIRSNAGAVWVERVSCVGGVARDGARIETSASVSMQRSTFTGGISPPISTSEAGMGIRISDSFVGLHDVIGHGGDGQLAPGPGSIAGKGGAGTSLLSGSLFASGCSFLGGKAGTPGLSLSGGAGLALSAPCTALESIELGGAGGTPPFGGPPGANVEGSSFLTMLAGAARHLLAPEPTRELAPATISVKGAAGEQVGILYETSHDSGFLLAGFNEVLLLPLATVGSAAFGAIPPSGTLDVPLATPSMPTSVLGTTLHMQCVHFDAPITYAVLGPPGAWTILDASL